MPGLLARMHGWRAVLICSVVSRPVGRPCSSKYSNLSRMNIMSVENALEDFSKDIVVNGGTQEDV